MHAKSYGAARTTSEIDEVADSIRRDGGTAEAITLDITDLDAATAAIAGLEAFDILANNAGAILPNRIGQCLTLIQSMRCPIQ